MPAPKLLFNYFVRNRPNLHLQITKRKKSKPEPEKEELITTQTYQNTKSDPIKEDTNDETKIVALENMQIGNGIKLKGFKKKSKQINTGGELKNIEIIL